jgi:hypothetical protein
MKLMIAGIVALTTATASPAATCLTSDRLAAARIAEFNAAMMVTTLRCSLINVDIKTSYDSFIVGYKDRLQGADEKLKKHFASAGGDGQKNYHAFYTAIGNRYGASKTDGAQCALFAAVANELAKAGASDEVLDKYAAALVPNPAIGGERCAELAGKP